MATANGVHERTDQPIDPRLIDDAVNEVKHSKPSSEYKLDWSPKCADILDKYYADHYSKINNNSPEYEIIQHSKVENISGDVLELPGGKANTFKFPVLEAAYVIIPMKRDGMSKVEVMNSKGEFQKTLQWIKGSLVYLSGNSTLKCTGDGSVICIMLALNPIS